MASGEGRSSSPVQRDPRGDAERARWAELLLYLALLPFARRRCCSLRSFWEQWVIEGEFWAAWLS